MSERRRKFMSELIDLLFKYGDVVLDMVKEWEREFAKAFQSDFHQYPTATTADVVVYYGGDC